MQLLNLIELRIAHTMPVLNNKISINATMTIFLKPISIMSVLIL